MNEQDTGGTNVGEVDLDIVDTVEGFWRLESEWRDFFERCARAANVFQSFEFLSHWLQIFHGPRDELAIVVGRVNGELAFLWPLVIQKTCGLRQLSTMGAPVSQYSDAIMAPRPDSEAVVARALSLALARKVDLVRLDRVRADALIATAMAGHRTMTRPRGEAPVIDLAGATDMQTFERRIKSGTRQDIRRNRRRLNDGCAIEIVSRRGDANSAALIAAGVRLKREWVLAKGQVGGAILDPRFERFLAACAADPTLGPNMNISAILRDAAPISVEISIACKDGLFAYLLAYDLAHSRVGPGRLQVWESIASAIERRHRFYDLLPPTTDYKAVFAHGESVDVRDVILPKSMAGRAYAVLWLGLQRPVKAALTNMAPVAVSRFIARSMARQANRRSARRADVRDKRAV